MNRIAFIIGDKFLYWHSIVLTLAVLSAICMFFALSVRNRENRGTAVIVVPMAFVLSLLFSRLVHWYCRPQGYAGLFSAITDYSRGSFALVGTFAGCLLTALLLRMLKVCRNLPQLLDEMCIAGAMGISLGRLSSLFTTADRGIPVPQWVPFPLASRLVNEVSGETEVRLAVFMFQFVIAGLLFVILLISYLRGKKRGKLRDGDTCLLFLLWYCASQAVLDSPRYDSLYFRSNGFVSVVQIFGILTVLLILILCSVRMFKAGQWKKFYLIVLTLPLLGLAGYMEYHVQRHGGEALFAYTVMSISMFLAVLLILRIRFYGKKVGANKKKREVPAADFSEGAEEIKFPESTESFLQGPQPAVQPQKNHASKHYKGKFASR